MNRVPSNSRVWGVFQRVIGGSGQAASSTIVGSVPGVLLPFFLAARFSSTGLADVYLYAFGYATFIYGLTYSPLEANVLPAAQSAMHLGCSTMRRFLLCGLRRAVLLGFGAVVISIAIAAILVPSSGPLGGLRGREQLVILGVMGVYIIPACVNGFLAACQYAFGRYNAALLSISLRSIFALVACLLVTTNFLGLILVAVGLGVGELCRTAWLLGSTARVVSRLCNNQNPNNFLENRDDLKYLRRSGVNAIASMASGATPVVDRAFAARLPAGSVTVLELGEKIVQIPLTIVTQSVILLLGSKWADRSSDQNRSSAVPIVNRLLCAAIGAALLLTAVVGAAGGWLTAVLGLPQGASLLGPACLLALSLPGAVLTNVSARYLTSSQRPGILPAYSILSLGMNVVGNYILGSYFGVAGIAMATLIARTVLGAVSYFTVRRRERDRALEADVASAGIGRIA